MKDFNKRIDELVKFAIEVKLLNAKYPNDMDLGKEIRKLILKKNEKTIKSSRKIS
jgi:hypothetical protein